MNSNNKGKNGERELATILRGGNEDDQCNFSSLVSFDWRSTIDTFDIKCTGDVGMEDLPESQIWV